MLLFFAVRWGPDKPSDNNVENGLARSELPLTMGMSANTADLPEPARVPRTSLAYLRDNLLPEFVRGRISGPDASPPPSIYKYVQNFCKFTKILCKLDISLLQCYDNVENGK